MGHTHLKTVPSAAGRRPVVTQAAYDRCEDPRWPKTTVKSQRHRPSAYRRRLEAISKQPDFWKKKRPWRKKSVRGRTHSTSEGVGRPPRVARPTL
jgi:hypothetical protein